MSILVVGDGPRDAVALPDVVLNLLGLDVPTVYSNWHHVSYLKGRGSAYTRKLKYLTRRALDRGCGGLAVVVDADKSPRREKLRELHRGRDEDRSSNPAFPTALGEAIPHFDAWLLDDPVAVRKGLNFGGDVEVPNAVKVDSPKKVLSKLIRACPLDDTDDSEILGEVARCLCRKRCVHAKKTGFENFCNEVDVELKAAFFDRA